MACNIFALIQKGTSWGFFLLNLNIISSSPNKKEPTASISLTVLISTMTPQMTATENTAWFLNRFFGHGNAEKLFQNYNDYKIIIEQSC